MKDIWIFFFACLFPCFLFPPHPRAVDLSPFTTHRFYTTPLSRLTIATGLGEMIPQENPHRWGVDVVPAFG